MEWADLISTVGFPIALVIGFCWFIAKYVERATNDNKEREQSLIGANEKLSDALNRVADTIVETNNLNAKLSENNRFLSEQINRHLEDIDNGIEKIYDKINISMDKNSETDNV